MVGAGPASPRLLEGAGGEGGGGRHHRKTGLQDSVGGARQGGRSCCCLQNEAAGVRPGVSVAALIKRMRNIRDNIRSLVLHHSVRSRHLSRHLNLLTFNRTLRALRQGLPCYQSQEEDDEEDRDDEDAEDCHCEAGESFREEMFNLCVTEVKLQEVRQGYKGSGRDNSQISFKVRLLRLGMEGKVEVGIL